MVKELPAKLSKNVLSAPLVSRSAEEIVERLKNPQAVVSQLVEEILKLGEREGIRAFEINMQDLTEWIAEVIAENKLTAIVLFWDEFSKFFGNNRNKQRINRRILRSKATKPFALSATEKVKDVAAVKWGQLSAALRERTVRAREVVVDFLKTRNEKIDEKILTEILPIHPLTAILLKNLAAYFASNQRSIFNFIKNNDPNVKAFQDFIATKSPDDGDLLTIDDYLWIFFYESGTDEHGGNVGSMNLKPSIRVILDSYSLNKDILNLDEQAVLRRYCCSKR